MDRVVSYCRWSSDNWKSDLYVYANVSGAWTIHIAGNRIVGDVPPLDLGARGAKWKASYKAHYAYIENCERDEITIPHAGEIFQTGGPAECADKIEELIALGYHVPDYVVPALREEAAEDDSA